MLTTTRKRTLLLATACLLISAQPGIGQDFDQPSESVDRPQPYSITSQEDTLPAEHSILDSGAASEAPALQRTETRQNGAPIVSSTVTDDPFESSRGIQRVDGSGEEALGTFATSDHMPPQSTVTAQDNRFLSAPSKQFSPQGQPSLPPISSNGLRGSMGGRNMGASASMGDNSGTRRSSGTGMSFGNQASNDRSSSGLNSRSSSTGFDSQPAPPKPSSQQSIMDSFGQRPVPGYEQKTTPLSPQRNNFANNRFSGPTETAPPIHNSPPAIQSNGARHSRLGQPITGQVPMIQDSNISPTQYQSAVQGASPTTAKPVEKVDLSLAKKIMQRYKIDSVPDPLPGQPTSLLDMLQRTPQHLQKKMITQYWETYFDFATVLNSTQYLDWLNQLVSPQNPAELVLLNAAKAAAKNQLLADEIQLGKSQLKLQQFVGQNQSQLLPLPSDAPLIQDYDTQYDWYASRNRMPESMRGINVMLPKAIKLVADRAATVGTTRVALSRIREAYTANPRQLGSILQAARMWNNSEQNLVGSIVNYNKAIADYSLTIAGGYRPPQQIVSMLIAKPKANVQQPVNQRQTAGRMDRGIQQAQPTLASPSSQFRSASQQRSVGSPQGVGNGLNRQYNSQQPSSAREFGLPPSRRSGNNGQRELGQRAIGQGGVGQRAVGQGGIGQIGNGQRTLGPKTDLSPRGFTGSQPQKSPAAIRPNPSLQPIGTRGAQQQKQPPTSPPAASPSPFRPQPNPQSPAGDRSAFRGPTTDNGTGFGGPRRAPQRPTSESANDFNSFGR